MKQPEALRWVNLLEYEATAHGPTDYKHKAAAELRRLYEANQEMLEALNTIERWSSHTREFALDFGSNGVRDFYRTIARAAIAKGE